jgi:hypothetical protein
MNNLTPEEIRESSRKAIKTAIPIIEKLVIEDSLFYIEPIKIIKKHRGRKRK